MEILAQKSKDGHVSNLLFSSEYIISYYCAFTFHITLFKLSCFFFNNVYSPLRDIMSFIHNNSYNSLKKSGHSNAARHLERKVFLVHRHRITEPRLFSVAINSLGTDADEVITEALP